VGTDGYRLGNIFERDLERAVFKKSPIKISKGKCNTCFAKYICGGGCYHENLGSTRSVFKPSECYCQMMQRSVELVAYMSSQLNEEDRAYMVNEKIIIRKPCPFDFPL
jgi:uncharacterized protein